MFQIRTLRLRKKSVFLKKIKSRPPRDTPFTGKVFILAGFLEAFSLLSQNLAKKNFQNYFLWASSEVKGHIRSNFQNENLAILMADSESLQKKSKKVPFFF